MSGVRWQSAQRRSARVRSPMPLRSSSSSRLGRVILEVAIARPFVADDDVPATLDETSHQQVLVLTTRVDSCLEAAQMRGSFRGQEQEMQSIESGPLAGIGSFQCGQCGYVVNLANDDTLPRCPGCGGTEFERASLFGTSSFTGRPWSEEDTQEPGWLDEAREALGSPGEYLAYERAGEVKVFE